MTEAITIVDQNEPMTYADYAVLLLEQEQRIERGLCETADALLTIRDDRLYRKETSTTFEDYCRARWGFSKSRANQLIAAGKTATNVVKGGLPAPTKEGQVRPLAGLPVETQRKAWARATKDTDTPTGKQVEVAIEIVRTKPETECVIVDVQADVTDDKTVRSSRLELISWQLTGIADGIETLEPADLVAKDTADVVKSLRRTRTTLSQLIKKLEASP